jgi:GT2 family glycosyltransferase
MHSVSIISVNFNHSHVTDALLDSIFRTNTYPEIEIIVVDNASTANPVPEWIKKYPNVKFIRSERNLGFAGGNNLGIQEAKGDYLFFVNNDTEFTPGLIETLVHTLDAHEEIGMVSPKIHYFDQPGLLQYAGFTEMNYYTGRNSCIGQFEKDNGQYDQATGPTGFGHGAAMMVRRTAMEKVGMMPEHFFLYYEEMDWGAHIRQAGYTIWVQMQALIYHKESISVGAGSALKEFFMNRNRILFIRRNSKGFRKSLFWLYFLAVVTPRNVVQYIREGHPQFIKVLASAIWWNCTNGINSKHLGYRIKQ